MNVTFKAIAENEMYNLVKFVVGEDFFQKRKIYIEQSVLEEKLKPFEKKMKVKTI